MALPPAPSPAAPVVRQQAVQQSASPVREIQVAMPLQSLTTSRVLIVVVTTISGGTKSHIPSTQIWDQIDLGGAGGFAVMGELLASAWWSRPGVPVYAAGTIQFGGMIGLAPEYATLIAMEFQDCQAGSILSLGASWSVPILQTITGQAPAVGQSVRGVVAVGVAEGQHNFTIPPDSRQILTQTSASGFFAAPFSLAGSYNTQSSNDPQDITLPFDGPPSSAGLLLFNVVTGLNDITSVNLTHTSDFITATPGLDHTVSSYLSPGGNVVHTSDVFIDFYPMTVSGTTDADLFGTPTLTSTSDVSLYLQPSINYSTDADLDVFNAVIHTTDITLLGTGTLSHTTDTDIVNSPSVSHTTDTNSLADLNQTTDAYLFAGQSFHTTDAGVLSTLTTSDTTDAYLVLTGLATATTDTYVQPPAPLVVSHTTDASLIVDNIISMTGWEFQDYRLEGSIFQPSYATSSPLSTITAAKRPGSQGSYGLRIDDTAGIRSNFYWLPAQNAKFLTDLDTADTEVNVAAAHYREIWTTFWFRCNSVPTDAMEQLVADSTIIVGGLPSESFGVLIGTYLGQECLQLYWGNRTILDIYPFFAPGGFSPTAWNKMEVRCLSGDLNPLSMASLAVPFTVEVYLGGQLVMTGLAPNAYAGYGPTLGVQKRIGVSPYQVDVDDLVVSSNRQDKYDQSIIAKPAKADGTYTAWASTPGGDYTDVDTIPYNVSKHKDSSSIGQNTTVKVYSGGDTNPYPGNIHAVGISAVMAYESSTSQNIGLLVRSGSTDLILHTFWANHGGPGVYLDHTVVCSFNPVTTGDWVSSIYNFEIGVAQVNDSVPNRIVLLAVNMLVSPTSCLHTTDADLFGTVTLTHTTDACLAMVLLHSTDSLIAGQSLSFTTDALPVQDMGLTHTTDAAVAGSPTLAHTTDLNIDNSIFQTTDTLIVREQGTTGTSDTLLIASVDQPHSTDSQIGSTVDLPHYTDVYPVVTNTITHTGDTRAIMTGNAVHTTNTHQLATLTLTNTTDSGLKALESATHTTDLLNYQTNTVSHTTSSTVLGTTGITQTVSSALQLTNTQTRTYTTDALVKNTFSISLTTDMLLKTAPSQSNTTDADLAGSNQASQTVSSYLVVPTVRTLIHFTDTDLLGTVTSPHTTDAGIKLSSVATHATSSSLQLSPVLTHTSDTILVLARALSYSTDAFLMVSPTATNTVDVLLRASNTASHTADTTLAGTVTVQSTTDADLFGTTGASHTTSAALLNTITSTHTVDSDVAHDLGHTTDADISPTAELQHIITSSLSGSSSTTNTTDIGVLADLLTSHTTDSALIAALTILHTTSSDIFSTVTLQSTTDAEAAFEKTQTTDTTAAGTGTSQGTTDVFLLNSDQSIFEPVPHEPDLNSLFPGAF